jgi:hypothetical protein
MSDTTSIDDLPTDPSTGSQNNIVIQKTEMNSGMGMGGGMAMNNQMQIQAPVYSPNISGGMGGGMGMQSQQQQQPMMMTQPNQNPGVMNEFMSGLQRASVNGMTSLSSRDIPMNTMNMMGDQQVKPNYVPQPQPTHPNNNYIEEHEADVANEVKYATEVTNNDNMENIYRLIQIPLLVGILYFAFQLPITRKYILKYLPSVFNTDGNYNISGLVFMSVLFALGYFGLTKMIESVESV